LSGSLNLWCFYSCMYMLFVVVNTSHIIVIVCKFWIQLFFIVLFWSNPNWHLLLKIIDKLYSSYNFIHHSSMLNVQGKKFTNENFHVIFYSLLSTDFSKIIDVDEIFPPESNHQSHLEDLIMIFYIFHIKCGNNEGNFFYFTEGSLRQHQCIGFVYSLNRSVVMKCHYIVPLSPCC
jgi:hypothetical protein